jgi:hypothetical protein
MAPVFFSRGHGAVSVKMTYYPEEGFLDRRGRKIII